MDRRLSIRQMMFLAIAAGIPYFAIGLVWLITHQDHLTDLHGVDRVFSTVGQVIAWPALVVADLDLR
ncbi:hypothetical protein [Nocardia rhizosphaerae]|uniref:Uncharacterized protein n=1 Tax=Nocardia rhizosphaerae TaxID=1691571 RepID=A0ABV8LCF0_9NOCA